VTAEAAASLYKVMATHRQFVGDGALLAGRYRLSEPIGRGGMAEVWRAEDVLLGRPVAIKWGPAPSAAGGAAAGVWREARDAARLIHPNVVAVYDVVPDGDRPFLVMELVEGRDLAVLLAERGPLPCALVARIGAQAARALDAAHNVGLVHRDVKPGNLLMTPDGTVKLADFGIAGQFGAAGDTGATRETGGAYGGAALDGGAAGTPLLGTDAYVAPERAVGLPGGPASDLYSLGCVLYELLAGHPPFPDDDPKVVVRRHVEDDPEPPGRLRPDIPADLEHAVLRLLAKNPADRPPSAERVAVVLQSVAETPAGPPAAAAEPATATRVLPTVNPAGFHRAMAGTGHAQPAEVAPPFRHPEPPPLLTWLGERPLPAAAAGAVVIISVVVALVAWLAAGDPESGTPALGVPIQVPTAATPSKAVRATPARPRRPPSPAALLSALDRRLAQQAATGRLDPKTAEELRHRTEEVAGKLAEGKTKEAAGKVREIRKKLDEAARKGKWAPDPDVTRLLGRLSTAL
jgi:serine/threonine-protein kinase